MTFVRHPLVIWDEVDGVLTLCHTESTELFRLNEVGAVIWQACDGLASVGEWVEQLGKLYPEEGAELLAREVDTFCASLHAAGLIVPAGEA